MTLRRMAINGNAMLHVAQAMLSPEMQKEMDEFKRQERDAKAESKAQKAQAKEEKSSKSTQSANQVKPGAAARQRGRATR